MGWVRERMRLVLLFATMLLLPDYAYANTTVLDEALWAEQRGNYLSARRLYQDFLESKVEPNSDSSSLTRASIGLRMSVLDEAIRFGQDPAVAILLNALTHRDHQQYDLAIGELRTIEEHYASSYLADDAQYLVGYIALMDKFDFAQAHESMRELLMRHPQTRYYDTALYCEAIALEQLGNTHAAIERFRELRQRHSKAALGLINFRIPRSEVASRYWFDRADRRLAILHERVESAARVITRRVIGASSKALRVTVDVDGTEMVLLLEPSQINRDIQVVAADGAIPDPTRAVFYSGRVEGDEHSWVRVSIEGNAIEGVVEQHGERVELHPETHIGTIDYYQPQNKPVRDLQPELQDYIMNPPDISTAGMRKVNFVNRTKTPSALRVAQIGIVVDSQYNDYYGGNGLTRALSALNVADGIFRSKFQLALEVVSAKVYVDRGDDPMNLGPVTLETMLRKFRDYRMQTVATSKPVNLMYLFSGNQNSDQAIGLAWIGAACRRDGYDVGVTTPSNYADLLVTHELGHSFGAQHDTDTNCSATTHRLMWPRISSLTEQEFSRCSQNVLTQSLSKSCYLNSLDVSLDLIPIGQSEVQMLVRNKDDAHAAQDVLLTIEGNGIDLSQLPVGCAAQINAEITCNTGTLAPHSEKNWIFPLAPVQGSGITVFAQVTPNGAADVYSADNQVQLDIRLNADGSTQVALGSVGSASDLLAENVASNGYQWNSTDQGYPASSSAGAATYLLALALLGLARRRLSALCSDVFQLRPKLRSSALQCSVFSGVLRWRINRI